MILLVNGKVLEPPGVKSTFYHCYHVDEIQECNEVVRVGVVLLMQITLKYSTEI